MEGQPIKLVIYRARWAQLLVACVAVAVLMLAVMTAVLCAIAYLGGDRDTIILLAAGWTILPPAWFWADYFLLFRRVGDLDQFEQFKHGQQVSASIWAAMALSLAALASSDALADKVTIKSHAAPQISMPQK